MTTLSPPPSLAALRRTGVAAPVALLSAAFATVVSARRRTARSGSSRAPDGSRASSASPPRLAGACRRLHVSSRPRSHRLGALGAGEAIALVPNEIWRRCSQQRITDNASPRRAVASPPARRRPLRRPQLEHGPTPLSVSRAMTLPARPPTRLQQSGADVSSSPAPARTSASTACALSTRFAYKKATAAPRLARRPQLNHCGLGNASLSARPSASSSSRPLEYEAAIVVLKPQTQARLRTLLADTTPAPGRHAGLRWSRTRGRALPASTWALERSRSPNPGRDARGAHACRAARYEPTTLRLTHSSARRPRRTTNVAFDDHPNYSGSANGRNRHGRSVSAGSSRRPRAGSVIVRLTLAWNARETEHRLAPPADVPLKCPRCCHAPPNQFALLVSALSRRSSGPSSSSPARQPFKFAFTFLVTYHCRCLAPASLAACDRRPLHPAVPALFRDERPARRQFDKRPMRSSVAQTRLRWRRGFLRADFSSCSPASS